MREDIAREQIKNAMERARDARLSGDEAQRRDALEEAWQLSQDLGDAALLATVSWRLAKARHDTGRAQGAFDALVPLVEQDVEERGVWGVKQKVGPFDHYPAGLLAMTPLTRRHWDQLGYGSATLETLWHAYVAHHEAHEDPFLAAWGQVQIAWQLACTGRLDDVSDLTWRFARISPGHFGVGPHRHPRAADVPTSIYWVQMDLARTMLRAATWQHDERRAWEAMELLEDAAEDTGIQREKEFWWLDAMLRAGGRFAHQKVVERYLEPYEALIESASPEDVPEIHQLRARAWLSFLRKHRASTEEFATRALDVARAHESGPEWIIESALLAAIAAPAERAIALREVAREEALRTGVSMCDLAGNPVAARRSSEG